MRFGGAVLVVACALSGCAQPAVVAELPQGRDAAAPTAAGLGATTLPKCVTAPSLPLHHPPPEALPGAMTATVAEPDDADAIAVAYAHKNLRWSGPADAPSGAMVIGSSSIRGHLGKSIAKLLSERGQRVLRLGVSGTGLARRDRFDWLTVVKKLPVPHNAKCALVYLGVNDAQSMTEPRGRRTQEPSTTKQTPEYAHGRDADGDGSDAADKEPEEPEEPSGGPLIERAMRRSKARGDGKVTRRRAKKKRSGMGRDLGPGSVSWRSPTWMARYEQRVTTFIDVLCARGVGRVVLMLPIDVRPKLLDRALRRIRAAQINAAARSQCGLAVATEGDAPRFALGKVKLRKRDGFHITKMGAQVVWNRIDPIVSRLLQ